MSEVMDKKAVKDESLDSVSGGTDRELWQLVELYNRYNPNDKLTSYSPKIEKWVCQLWGCKPGAEVRPLIFDADGFYLNSYFLPGYGAVDHSQFLKLVAERADLNTR